MPGVQPLLFFEDSVKIGDIIKPTAEGYFSNGLVGFS
jgi:hypothetical protein